MTKERPSRDPSYRLFDELLQGLNPNQSEHLRTNTLVLINSIIISTEDLDYRMHLRNEFMREGLSDMIEVSKEGENCLKRHFISLSIDSLRR